LRLSSLPALHLAANARVRLCLDDLFKLVAHLLIVAPLNGHLRFRVFG